MTPVLQTSESDDPFRPHCTNCSVDMWLVNLRRNFIRGDMTEERHYECLACGSRATRAVTPLLAAERSVAVAHSPDAPGDNRP